MILVTGGTGVMGSVLVKRLYDEGYKVCVLSLPDDPNVSAIKDYAADIRYGDISVKSDMENICEGIDLVYHLAAVVVSHDESLFKKVNIEGTRNLVEAAQKANVEHFIYISSASVIYPKSSAYSRSKQVCEEVVAFSTIPFTIIRPTLVYDVNKGGQEFDMFVSYLRKMPVIPFVGSGNVLKRPVFVEDIINGLLAIKYKETTFRKFYNFSGGEEITLKNFAKMCLKLMGKPYKPIIHLPVVFCIFLASVLKRILKKPPLTWQIITGMTQDANLDPMTSKKDLGYSPVKVTEKLPECFPRF
jgi:NADH dehydrogenase